MRILQQKAVLCCLMLTFTLSLFAADTQVYKWTDESGRVHFGDAPSDQVKAEPVELIINTYTSVSYENLGTGVSLYADKVVMYSTSWCGYCKKARRYFQQQGIAFREYDIEKDARARQRYEALGARGVPVILVGNKRMNGFSEQGFERLLTQ